MSYIASQSAQKLLSTTEVADQLGLSASYLNQLRLRGGGPRFVKLGVRVVYDPSDVSAWVEASKRSSTSDLEGAPA